MPETTCVVPGCSQKGRHMFPRDKSRRKAWEHAIKRGEDKFKTWSASRYSYICEHHFSKDDYHQESFTFDGHARKKRSLKKTAVPSIFYWTCPESQAKAQVRKNRLNARETRKRDLLQDVPKNLKEQHYQEDAGLEDGNEFVAYKLDLVFDELGVGAIEEVIDETNTSEVTEVAEAAVDSQVKDEETNINVDEEEPNAAGFGIRKFRNDDAAVHFYTGLETFRNVVFVLDTLGPAAYHLRYIYHKVTKLSILDQFFLVLIKLRRHTTNFELSRMFEVSEATVSNVFLTWILFMNSQWKELNLWPSQKLVRYFSPSGFKRNYPNTRIIIDGTECPMKKPKNPSAQQATFSTYKNRNTVKVLVGATPGGLVSYMSNAYGGSTSDRQIVERSGLPSLCDVNDSIMADKGFNVQDIFAPKDIQINIPTFFKKKNRMSGETVVRDRKISSKRVHIERIIGLAKTFKILVESMTATEAKLSSEIIFVCFMLCNFRTNIVPNYA